MRNEKVFVSGIRAMLLASLAAGIVGCGVPSVSDGSLYRQLHEASAGILVGGRLEGSGCFIDAGGLVLTAGHVVAGKAGPFEIVSPVEGRLPAEVLATDYGHDLALLRVAARGKPYSALMLAAQCPSPGQPLFIFGAPMFRTGLMLSGAAAEGAASYEYSPSYQDYVEIFHISGPSPHGTSGGSWVDGHGRVVGVQSGMIVREKAAVGIGFAAPLSAIRRLVETRKTIRTPSIGGAVENLFERPRDVIAKFPPGQGGVVVERLQKDGPFEAAGLTPGMLLVALDGQPITGRNQFLDRIRAKRPGDRVCLRILEPSKKTRDLTVRLGAMAPQPQTQPQPQLQPQPQPQTRPQSQPRPQTQPHQNV